MCAITSTDIENVRESSAGLCSAADSWRENLRAQVVTVLERNNQPTVGSINLSPVTDENGNVVLAPNYTVDHSYHVQEIIHPQTGAVTQATLPGTLKTHRVIGTECETETTEFPAPNPTP